MLDLFNKLGADGMSSEDTEIEDLQTVYRPRILPWRRNIDDWLALIDKERRKSNQTVYSSAGHAPRKRIRASTNQVSAREPPAGLPKSLYDPQWKSQLDADYIDTMLCPGDEEFPWYVLRSATTKGDDWRCRMRRLSERMGK